MDVLIQSTNSHEGNSVRGEGAALVLGRNETDGLILGVGEGSADIEGLSDGVELG